MKKKTIFILAFICSIIIVISLGITGKIIKDAEYDRQCDEAFDSLFVTERNEVFKLYRAIGETVESKPLDKRHYQALLEITNTTEAVCMQTFGKLSDTVGTFGAGLVYYGTFYRDIRSLLSNECGENELQNIYAVLGEIIALYDEHSQNAESSDKLSVISGFYYSLSLRNEEWMQLCK